MRGAHYSAFEGRVKSRVPALASLTFDGDASVDDAVRRGSYLVLHDMGFDYQDDDRLSANPADVADGTYRVVVRVVGEDPAAVRNVADAVKSGLVGQVLTISGRNCGAISKDNGPDGIERDTTVSPPLFWVDLDFIWRSTRA